MPAARPRRQPDDRRGIQSIETGFALIDILARAPGKISLTRLAADAGMTPSKAHLYLVSFMRLGIVVQDPLTSRYGLGPTAIELGLAAINQQNVVDAARGYMEGIVEEFGVSMSVSVWGNRGATIIFRLDGRWPVPLSVKVGFVVPLLTTATGRIFIAHLPEHEWHDMAQIEEMAGPGRLERALRACEAIRRDGLALTDSEHHRGFVGVSAPVFDSSGKLAAAITALGMSTDPVLRPDGDVVPAISWVARAVSRDIGLQG